jgi:hypothetical protein
LGHRYFPIYQLLSGRYITIYHSTFKKLKFDAGRILIVTALRDFIARTTHVEIKCSAFSMKVTEEPCFEVNPSCVDKRKVVETRVGKSNPSPLGRKTSVVGFHGNNEISKTK